MDRMYSDNIRHLPVVDDADHLVGMLSTRDIAVAASVRGMDPTKITVANAMTAAPFTCPATTTLADVSFAMERDRLGSVIVTEGGKPVGMFTTTDAMRALRAMLAGGPVEPATHSTHIVDHSGERKTTTRSKASAKGVTTSDGTLSWFLGM
jgi:acetoin utilization protein AcuB